MRDPKRTPARITSDELAKLLNGVTFGTEVIFTVSGRTMELRPWEYWIDSSLPAVRIDLVEVPEGEERPNE